MSALRFKIGEAFPADDPIARFVTGLAMICNDWLRFMGDFAKAAEAADADADEEGRARHVAAFRFQAALLHEAAEFITTASRRFPEIVRFVDGLEEQAKTDCERVVGAVDPKSPHFLGAWIGPHRNVTFHYPEMHPDKARSGNEELATALAKAHWIESEIAEVDLFGKIRFYFADQVGAQLVPDVRDRTVFDQFGETGVALSRFAQLATKAYLVTRRGGHFSVSE